MKIKVNFEKFKREINKANIACLKAGQNQNLKSILLKTENNSLVIRSTNIDIGYESVLLIKTEREGEFSILGDVFARLLSTINIKENIEAEIEIQDNLCIFTVGEHNFTLKTTDSSNFPNLPKVNGEVLIVDNQNFLNNLKSVVYSVAKSELKPEIAGVYITLKDEYMYFVGTDAYRLCERKVKIEENNLENLNFIIPEKNVKDIIRVFEDNPEKNLKITISSNSLMINTENVYLITRLIDGNFPNYTQIIPSNPTSLAVFLKEDLVKALKIASFFSDKTQQIILNINQDICEIESSSIEIGNSKEKVKVNLKGDDFSVKINSKYLEEFLQNNNEQSIILKFTAQNKALIVQGINDANYTYLLMPSYR